MGDILTETELILFHAKNIQCGIRKLIEQARLLTESPDRPRFLLFLTIAEQFEVALLLIDAGMASHAAIHVRSMIEAIVDMHLLEKDSKHACQMYYETFRGGKNLCEELLRDPYLDPESKQYIQRNLRKFQRRYKKLHGFGMRPKKISDGFSKSGMLYFAMSYVMLCGFSHNDLSILYMRHQGKRAMTYRAPDKPQLINMILYNAVSVIMIATNCAGQIASFPEGLFSRIFDDMNKSWVALMSAAEVFRKNNPREVKQIDTVSVI